MASGDWQEYIKKVSDTFGAAFRSIRHIRFAAPFTVERVTLDNGEAAVLVGADTADLIGPTGPEGPAGDTGATGPTGPQGPAGSANASGTTNTLGKFTGSTTVGDSTVTDSSGVVGTPSTIQITKDASGATDVVGLDLANTTSTGTTEQRPPTIKQRGYGRDTGGGGSQKAAYAERTVHLTAANGGPIVEVIEEYDVNGSGGTFGKWMTSLPGFGGVGLYTANTILVDTTSNGLRSAGSGNPGWKFQNSGVDSVWDAGSGTPWIQFASGNVKRLYVGAKLTTTSTSAASITTFSAVDETAYTVTATFTIWENNTGVATFVRRATFRRDGGTLSQQGTAQTIGMDEIPVGFVGLSVDVDASGTTIRFRVTPHTASSLVSSVIAHICAVS